MKLKDLFNLYILTYNYIIKALFFKVLEYLQLYKFL